MASVGGRAGPKSPTTKPGSAIASDMDLPKITEPQGLFDTLIALIVVLSAVVLGALLAFGSL